MSQGQPLMKSLPHDGSDIRKIKVRKKKSLSEVGTLFNEVFSDPSDLRQRCILAHGRDNALVTNPNHDNFFIFPVNGFQFMHSPNVFEMEHDYKQRLVDLQLATSEEEGKRLLRDVISFEYVKNQNLVEAITRGDEIVIYGIPYYYAIRESSVKSYSTLFSL